MRFDTDTFSEIASSLLRNKTRSILTGFGVFWGVFMLLFLVGAGGGFKQSLAKNFEGFATNSVFMVSDKTTRPYAGFREGRSWSLNNTDIERLKQMIPEIDYIDAVMVSWGNRAYAGSNKTGCILKGMSDKHYFVEEPQIKYGRYLNQVDVEQERHVCVIGKRVYSHFSVPESFRQGRRQGRYHRNDGETGCLPPMPRGVQPLCGQQ